MPLFVAFRILFNVRFYYPVFMILFLDFGITLEQFGLLNAAWAAAIVLLEVPSGALADLVGRRRLLVAAAGLMVVAEKMTAVLAEGLCREMPWQAIRLRTVELRVRKLRTAKP